MPRPLQFSKRLLLSLCVILAASSLASAQTFATLHSFDGVDGAGPLYETLAQGRDGNLYGTTSGGTVSDGTVFRITPQGALSVYTFDGTHGSGPFGGLVLGIDGLLRGTAQFGGTSNDGVVFSIGPQ